MIYRKKQYLGTEEEKLSADIIYGENKRTQTEINAMLLDQIPVGTATGTTINIHDSANLPLKSFELQGNATQDDTPTPATPQAIHVVTGDNTIKITGKNMLDNSKTTYNYTNSSGTPTITTIDTGLRFALTTSGTSTYFVVFKSIDLNNYIGKIVRLKATFGTNGGVRLGICNSTCTSRTQKATTTTSGEEISFTVTNDMGEQHYLTYILSKSNGNTTTSLDFTNLILTIDNADMTYEPYQEQTVTLPLGDIELAGIPNTDYKDRIFKAEVGDEFYDSLTNEQKATLTLGKWYKYGIIGKKTLTGSETWNGTNSYYTGVFVSTALALPSSFGIVGYSQNFPVVSYGLGGTDNLYFHTNKNLQINKSDTFPTKSDWTTWLSNNNQTIYYILATAEHTEITDTALITALEQILAMTTYKTTTNAFTLTVSDNATPTLVMEYRQDIGTLISNLNNAILSLGNNV